MSEETINGLRSTKAAVQEYGHASKGANNFGDGSKQYRIHTNCILNILENNKGRKPKRKKKNRLKLTKRTLDGMKQEEKRLHEKLEQLTSEHTAVEEAHAKGYRICGRRWAKIKNA